MVLGGLGGLLLLVVGGFVAGYLLVTIPPANAAATAQSNVYLYADGSRIARDGDVNRENTSLSRVPVSVQHAVLAAEDRDFYSEPGVDPLAMARGLWNTLTGKGRQSGSTITQQYVKNYYLDQEQTLTRKVKEFFIAIKLDREESKRNIFQGYLNTSYFGRNTYGIQAAAQAYYGVDAAELSTAQGAYLASLLNAPSAYDVVAHPEHRARAVARWNYVLDGMVKEHWLSPEQRRRMTFPTPRPAKAQAGLTGQRGYLVRAVHDYLVHHHVIGRHARGYRITTTLRREQQRAFETTVHDRLLSRLDPQGRPVDRTVRAGGAAIDPATGKVVALYGGVDYTRQYVNNATRRDYQVGSAFKPFVLAAAVQHGAVTQSGETITPNTTYDGTDRRPVQGWPGARYAPHNEDNHSYGHISVREATDKSVNAVYAQMAVDVGPSRVKDTAIALGLPEDTRDMPAGPAIALGTATASPLDMAQAYATLANHGVRVPYTLVEKVTKDGRNIRLPARPPRRAVSREAADTTTAVLESVVQRGTGTAAAAVERPAAGKTGTAEDDTAAWFAGYTPDLATVVAVMGQHPRSGAHSPLYGALGEPRMNGGGYPARIWAGFTSAALGPSARSFELQLQPGAEESASPSPDTSSSADGGDDGTGGVADSPDAGDTGDGGTEPGGTGAQGAPDGPAPRPGPGPGTAGDDGKPRAAPTPRPPDVTPDDRSPAGMPDDAASGDAAPEGRRVHGTAPPEVPFPGGATDVRGSASAGHPDRARRGCRTPQGAPGGHEADGAAWSCVLRPPTDHRPPTGTDW